jgi:hypothetical protein
LAKNNPPVLHLVEDAEKAFLHALQMFSPPFFPNDRESIMDHCRAFQDRLGALDIDAKEIERRRLKILHNAYDSKTANSLDIDLALETPSADPLLGIKAIAGRGQEAVLGDGSKLVGLKGAIAAAFREQQERKEDRSILAAKKRAQEQVVYEQELEKLRREAVERAESPPSLPVPTDPKSLRNFYFKNFPDEKIKVLDLCWAAGQHYSEWKRWLRGALKKGSAPDLAFTAIMKSRKRPQEYRKQVRPARWK